MNHFDFSLGLGRGYIVCPALHISYPPYDENVDWRVENMSFEGNFNQSVAGRRLGMSHIFLVQHKSVFPCYINFISFSTNRFSLHHETFMHYDILINHYLSYSDVDITEDFITSTQTNYSSFSSSKLVHNTHVQSP
jgi:hypothetical protein